MRRMLWAFTLLAVCFLAVLWIWQDCGKRREVPPLVTPKTKVEVFEGAVEVHTGDVTNVLKEGDKLVGTEVEGASRAPEPIATEVKVAEATETAHDPAGIYVRVVDAMRDPIPEAWLRIADRTIQTVGGEIEFSKEEIASALLVAGAAGFAEATRSIRADLEKNQREFEIELEYLCAFDVRVMRFEANKTMRPVGSGVEVRVYEGPKPPRPPKKTMTVRYTDLQAAHPAKITQDERGPRVVETYMPRVADDPPTQELNERYNHKPGDLITQVGTCVWESGGDEGNRYEDWWNGRPYRSRIRIWDSLAAYSAGQSFTWRSLHPLIVCDRRTLEVSDIDPVIRGGCVAIGTTDVMGHCQLDNLPAGTYFVQAMDQGARSAFATVCPAMREVSLIIMNEAMLFVDVLINGTDNSRLLSRDKGFIENAHVIAKRKDPEGGGLYTNNTRDNGSAVFNLPFGVYDITAVPPDSYSTIPTERTVSVTVEVPELREAVTFDSSTLFRVTGKVLEAETRDPVEGYVLELGTVSFDYFQSQGLGLSQEDGSFEIARIPNGRYSLRTRPSTFKHFDYVPPEYIGEPENDESKFGMIVKVDGADVTDIEYLVHKSATTRFSGRVVDPTGRPMEGVRVKFRRGEGYRYIPQVVNKGESPTITTETGYGTRIDRYEGGEEIIHTSRTKTDMEGRFSLAIQSLAYDQICTGTLIAEYDPDNDYVSERKGNLEVEFHTGDTLENLEIALSEGKDDYSTITGEILTEDGDPLYSVWVDAAQMDGYKNMDPKVKGSHYQIDWVKPGRVEIQVRPGGRSEYCAKQFHIDIPQEPSTITYDLILEKGAPIRGRIIDRKMNPVPNVSVLACATPTYYHCVFTDEEGKFEIERACARVEYDLSISTRGTKKDLSDAITLGSLLGVRPPAEDIVIMVDRP
ncbi:MAG: hypothetical protein ABIH23_16535 [bacterium]